MDANALAGGIGTGVLLGGLSIAAWVAARMFGLRAFRYKLDHRARVLADALRLGTLPGTWVVADPEGIPAIDLTNSLLNNAGYPPRWRGWFELREDRGRVIVTDCQFNARSGGQTITLTQTIAVLDVPGVNLPTFAALPAHPARHWLSRYPEVHLEHPSMGSTYRIEGIGDSWVRGLFLADAGEGLLSMIEGSGWWVEGDRDRLIIFKLDELLPPEELIGFAQSTLRLAGAVQRSARAA